jgi:hypothetical protein
MVGDVLDRYESTRLHAEVRWATWELTVFEVVAAGRDPIFVAVRRRCLERFLEDLWSGSLDAGLAADAASPAVRRRRLADGDGVRDVAVVGSVVDPARLPPAERDRGTGSIGSDPPRGRRDKRRSHEPEPADRPRVPPRGRRALVAAAVVAGLVVAVVAVALAATAGDGDPDVATGDGPAAAAPGDAASGGGPFAGRYAVTAVVEHFEDTPGYEPSPADYQVGQTITFTIDCGETFGPGATFCTPPLDANGASPPESIYVFPADDLEPGGPGRVVVPGDACPAGGDEGSYGPTVEVVMAGYTTETIAGTYRQTWDTLSCPRSIDANGLYYSFDLQLRFTGRLLDPTG